MASVDELRERARVVDGHVGEDLAVDLDARLAQTLDETVVGDAVSAGGSVDALDPELAELALLGAAVAVAVAQRVLTCSLALRYSRERCPR